MKSQLQFLLLFLSACSLAPAALAAAKCDNGSLSANYAYSATGFVPLSSKDSPLRYDPLMQIAVVTYDGKGAITVRGTQQYQGKLGALALNGEYEIKESCIGKASFKNGDGSVAEWRFAVVQDGGQVETLALQPASGGRPMYSVAFSQKKF